MPRFLVVLTSWLSVVPANLRCLTPWAAHRERRSDVKETLTQPFCARSLPNSSMLAILVRSIDYTEAARRIASPSSPLATEEGDEARSPRSSGDRSS